MENASNVTALAGVTSLAYHIVMWIVVTTGMTANTLVLMWICCNKTSRFRLVSGLIVSLALANAGFCCHFLLQEVMLHSAVFESEGNSLSYTFTKEDEVLCACISFLAMVSTCAIMLTAVAIALFLVFAMNPRQEWGHRLVAVFIVTSWLACLVLGAAAVWRFRIRSSFFPLEMDRNTYSLVVVYACQTASAPHHPGHRFSFSILVTAVNALCSLIVSLIYVYMLCKTRGDSHNATTQNPTNWKFRLVVISIVDVICWWPACILYVIPFATGTSVYSGNYSPEYSEPVLVLVAAVTVANPILYVIMAKDFTTATRKFCWRHCVCLDRFNKDQEYIRTVTGVDIRVYDSTSGPTDTTKLLSENSRTEDTKYGYRSI